MKVTKPWPIQGCERHSVRIHIHAEVTRGEMLAAVWRKGTL